jgi:hypothetical protein
MNQLQFEGPNIIIFQTKELKISVLGGIELYHLDRMRVTLKLEILSRQYPEYLNHPEIASIAIRQNLDLYNDQQVEKICRKVSEKMEIAGLPVIKAIAELTELLEQYRQDQLKQQLQDRDKTLVQLTDLEKEAAVNFLKAPELMKRTSDAISESGIIGEKLNCMIMYMVFTSRKKEHPLHIISLGSSGTGKTHLQESIGALIPEEDKIEITSLSSNALYYFEQHILRHKLLLIEDLDGADQALFPIRELQSKRKITKTVSYKDSKGNTKTMHLTVDGPVCISGCTTKESIYEDNANRSFLLQLDESKEQDEAVMQYQRLVSAGKIDKQKERITKKLLQDTQRMLQSVTVINPFAELLRIPEEVFKPRRTNAHYLQFVEAVTFYHQYQRKQKVDKETGEVFIETTVEDIEQANELMKEVLFRKSDGLSGATRNYVERLKQYLSENSLNSFDNNDIQQNLRLPHSTIMRYHKELLHAGLLKVIGKENRNFKYTIINQDSYNDLKGKVIKVLDDVLLEIKSTIDTPSQ